MKTASRYVLGFVIVTIFVCAGSAQTKKTPRPEKKTTVTAPTDVAPTPEPTPLVPKKNERPSDAGNKGIKVPKNYTPTYFYEFTRPGFVTSHILIEHDVTGNGKISFIKQDFNELMTDPLQLTPETMKGINETLDRMNFLGSTEDYQYEKDFSNMGNIVFRYAKDGRERTVKYNWTTNKDAKFLMDEYRRISNEAVWKFELAVSRENQPLESPGMLDALDSYLRRGEITDPPHLIPLLKELSNDERLPLIARNHAGRLITQIEKIKK